MNEDPQFRIASGEYQLKKVASLKSMQFIKVSLCAYEEANLIMSYISNTVNFCELWDLSMDLNEEETPLGLVRYKISSFGFRLNMHFL